MVGPSVQDELRELRDKVKALQEARDNEKLDERFGELRKIISLQEESTAGQIKLIRSDVRTIADQLRESNSLLMEVSGQVNENRALMDRGMDFTIRRNGIDSETFNKKLGELLILNIDAE